MNKVKPIRGAVLNPNCTIHPYTRAPADIKQNDSDKWGIARNEVG